MSERAMKATKIAVYLGVTLGLLGWVIGVVGVSLSTSTPGLMNAVLWPGLGISLGLAAVLVIVLEAIIARYGPGHPMFFGALWGLLLFYMGLLLLLISNWVAPIIDRYPEVVRVLEASGSVYRVSDAVSTTVMLIGAGILVVVAVVFARDLMPET